MKKRSFRIYIKIIYSLSFLYFLSGCTATSSESTLMKNMEGVKMTSSELSIRLNEFVKYFDDAVEETADEIIKKSNSMEVKRNALEWKINVIPRVLETITISDPVAAGIDIYALCLQMDHFFKEGNGSNLFGEQQQLAINISDEIFNEIRILSDDFREFKEGDEIEKQIQDWVGKNPVVNLRFSRKSTMELMAKALGRKNLGLGSTIGSMAEGIHILGRQVNIYSEFLPKHIKWQIEYELTGLMMDSTMEKTFDKFNRMSYSIEGMAKVLGESREALKNLQQSSFSELHKQLLFTISTLKNERAIVLDTLKAERMAILHDIYQQRIETLDRIDSIAQNTIIQSSLIADSIIDKIFWRAMIVFALVFLSGIVLLRIYKK